MWEAYFESRSIRRFLAFCGVLFLISTCMVGGWGIHTVATGGPRFDIVLSAVMVILFLATGLGCLLVPRWSLAWAHRRQRLLEDNHEVRPSFEMSLFWPIGLGIMFSLGVVMFFNDPGPHPPGSSFMRNAMTWMVRGVAALAWIGFIHGLLIRFHFRHWGLRLDQPRLALGQWGNFELVSARPISEKVIASMRLSGAQLQDTPGPDGGTTETRRHPVAGEVQINSERSADARVVRGRFRVDNLRSRRDDLYPTVFQAFLFVRDGFARVCVFPLPIDSGEGEAGGESQSKETSQ